jgi:hypothetical protein
MVLTNIRPAIILYWLQWENTISYGRAVKEPVDGCDRVCTIYFLLHG